MTAPTYTLAETAKRVGLSGERLRKVWKNWRAELAFPSPLSCPPLGNYAWDKTAVDNWATRRSATLGTPTPEPAAANDVHPADARHDRAAANLTYQRQRLAALMQQGA